MKTVEEKIVKTYTVQFADQDYHRHADIIFINGVFDRCIFKTQGTIYNILDWKWLEELAEEVIRLTLKEEKENSNLQQ